MNNKRQGTGITKGLIVGVFLIPLHCYWLIHMEMLRYFGHATIIGIFFNVIFSIFLIVLINPLLRKISLKLVFSQQYVLIVFIVLSMTLFISICITYFVFHNYHHWVFNRIISSCWYYYSYALIDISFYPHTTISEYQ